MAVSWGKCKREMIGITISPFLHSTKKSYCPPLEHHHYHEKPTLVGIVMTALHNVTELTNELQMGKGSQEARRIPRRDWMEEDEKEARRWMEMGWMRDHDLCVWDQSLALID